MKKEELIARRERYFKLFASGMNFTAAAVAVGVSKRTGKVWRNGRTRTSGRNEAPSVDWYRGDMPEPAPLRPKTPKYLLTTTYSKPCKTNWQALEPRADPGLAGTDCPG